MRKIVVTGATSMLGSALIRRLLKSPGVERIHAVIRPVKALGPVDKRQRLPISDRISIVECDLKDYNKLPLLINDSCDVFYHMAWPRTATYEETIDDTLLKCDAMKGVVEAVGVAHALKCTTFVGAGSQSEYGVPTDGVYSVNMPCNPVRIDGMLHLSAGQIGRTLAEGYGMIFVWMRIFSVYGTNDRKNSMISSTIDKLVSGEHCAFTESEQTWDYVYEDDVADAFYLVGEKAKCSQVYNMASGVSYPLKDYITSLRDIVAPQETLGFGEIPYPPNPIMKMEVDVSNLKKDTGWSPSTTFEKGIQRIFEAKLQDRT